MSALQPSASLLCKLGSIAVHADELTSTDGHAFDKAALDVLMNDAEVREWMREMAGMGMLPVKRAGKL